MLTFIDGGVCAARGFRAAGVHCGVKNNLSDKKDLALIVSDVSCAAAGIFTANVVKAAPVLVSRAHLRSGRARAVIANSGNANACAPGGEENAEKMCALAAAAVGCGPEEVLVGSTGVIGQSLNIAAIEAGLPALAAALSAEGSDSAARAIMTTDTVKKEFAAETGIGGKAVRLGGISKGSGMIHPNMGTMLCFVTTDCAVSPDMLRAALKAAADRSFHRISVDGDTSTNDTFCVLANGLAGNREITAPGADYDAFLAALTALCVKLARAMAADGEGAKHLITCSVTGAESEAQAVTLAKSVIGSSLTKAAIFGCDANWGRILCALGYSGAAFDPDKVGVAFRSQAGRIPVCRLGRGLAFDEELAKKILSQHEVVIEVEMGAGDGAAECWGCDLTYDYVKINGDYRT